MKSNLQMKEIFEGRICTKCGKWKPSSDFYFRKCGDKPSQCKSAIKYLKRDVS
jgi:ribosomal protein L40E